MPSHYRYPQQFNANFSWSSAEDPTTRRPPGGIAAIAEGADDGGTGPGGGGAGGPALKIQRGELGITVLQLGECPDGVADEPSRSGCPGGWRSWAGAHRRGRGRAARRRRGGPAGTPRP